MFSDVPLDARVNQQDGISPHAWLRTVTVEELAWAISSYGEDDDAILAERVAEVILARQRDRNLSTKDLADIVKFANHDYDDSGKHQHTDR